MDIKNKKTVLASLKLLKSKLPTSLHQIQRIELSVKQTQAGEFQWSVKFTLFLKNIFMTFFSALEEMR
jgi:hypothetical protein